MNQCSTKNLTGLDSEYICPNHGNNKPFSARRFPSLECVERLALEQKLISEAELQTHFEDGWKGVGVLPNGRIVVERDESAARGLIDTVRRLIEPSDLETYLKKGWHVATIRTALVLPSGKYVVERPRS